MAARLDSAERERRAIAQAYDWAAVHVVYADRATRVTNPEGWWSNTGQWFPTLIEGAEGSGTKGRWPSKKYPYPLIRRCRTRQHCRHLMSRTVAGHAVPNDVARALACMLLWLAGYETPTPAAYRLASAVAPAAARLAWLRELRDGGHTGELAVASMAPHELRAMLLADCGQKASAGVSL